MRLALTTACRNAFYRRWSIPPASRNGRIYNTARALKFFKVTRQASFSKHAVSLSDFVFVSAAPRSSERRRRPTRRLRSSTPSPSTPHVVRRPSIGGGGFMCDGGGFVCDAAARVWRALLRRVRMAAQRLGFCGGGGWSWRREAASLAAAQGRGRPRHRGPTCERGRVGLAQSRHSEGEVSEN